MFKSFIPVVLFLILPFIACAQKSKKQAPKNKTSKSKNKRADKQSSKNKKDFAYYQALNEAETRLPEFKDSDEILQLKLVQLERINKYRKKYKAQPVDLDILACRVANKMSKESCENGYLSHWNMAGYKPYHRWAAAGGHDHIMENAYVKWAGTKFAVNNTTRSDMMEEGLRRFMAEKKPADGHKRNIINKAHNHVGLGCHLTTKQFSYYEEFVDRYYEFENVPNKTLAPNEKVSITVKPEQGQYLYYAVAYYEKFPKPIKPSKLSKKGGYSDFTDDKALEFHPWELANYRTGDAYTIPMQFKKPGLYYIHLYQNDSELKKPTGYSTKGKRNASGIVIRVEK